MIRTAGSLRLAAEVKSHDLTKAEAVNRFTRAMEGGWTYPAIAQFYAPVINDRGMSFRRGSGLKTIGERVPKGLVTITDGHPVNAEASAALGRVLSAGEVHVGVEYLGFISRSEPEIAQKLADRTIAENSIDITAIEAKRKFVKPGRVPEKIRQYVPLNEDGLAVIASVTSWRWEAVGLVVGSSQSRQAVQGPPTLVPFQELAACQGEWNADAAAAQLSRWAGGNSLKSATAHLGHFYASDGREILAGQIASPGDGDGEGLIVNPAAIPGALADLRAQLKHSGLAKGTQKDLLHQAFLHTEKYLCGELTAAALSDRPSEGAPEIAAEAPGTQEAASESPNDPAADSPNAAGPASPPTDGSERAAELHAAQTTYLDRAARYRETARRIREVAHEPAGTSRGASTGSQAGH